jgi:hypothetical protein
VQIGCHLPVYGPAATREVLLGFARRMEALGYDSLWASDHVVIPYTIASRYPYNPTGDFPLAPTTSFLEPLVALGLVAGVTERIASARPCSFFPTVIPSWPPRCSRRSIIWRRGASSWARVSAG